MVLIILGLVSSGVMAADQRASGQKGTLVFADAGWDSIRIHNAIAATIIEKGYGYKTEVLTGSSPIVIQGLRQGDIDICMEAWTDNILELYQGGIAEGEIIELSVNFDDNAQGLYVPTYVIKGDPERGIPPLAPDLKSIKDLPRYWQVFQDPDNPAQGRIYGSPPGWAADQILRTKMETYNLHEWYDYFNPGSDTALNTSLVSAYEKGEPWVGYYWDPTWITGKYDLTLLADEPYTIDKWEAGYACEFPGVKVTVAVNARMPEKAPEVMAFLKNYRTSTKITSQLLAFMQDHAGDIEATTQWFFAEYEDLWTSWVTPEVAAAVKGERPAGPVRFQRDFTRFPAGIRLNLGIYVEKMIAWVTANFQGLFAWLKAGVFGIVSLIRRIFTFIPWFILIILLFLLGWKLDQWKTGLLYASMIFVVGGLGLWDEMILTLSIVLTGVLISVVIGIPIGIIMAYNNKVEAFVKPLLDGAQTMPSFVYLIPAMIFFGLGTVPAVFATIIYSVPPCIRLTNLGIRGVPRAMKEAAYAFGSSRWQVLTKVELPQAIPTIMAGINQTTMAAMSMVVISSMIGAKGLGENVLIAINRTDIAMGFDAGISIVFLAIIIDRITQRISNSPQRTKSGEEVRS
jgi:glycine betaine/proline transport system permease protein/glycine betaine/proline transport system substrate-binding protein